MAADVDLPAIGKVKKGWVWAGAGAVALIVGIAYWKHRQNANAAASSDTTTATTAIDPETGYTEGSPQDLAALASLQQGEYSDTGDTGTGAAGELYYDPADGLYDLTSPYDSTSATTTPNTGPGTFTTNAAWVAYAIANVTGYSAADVQTALALYLAGQPLSTTQMSIYQAALAVAGSPPDPPSAPATIQSTGTGTTTSTGTGTTTSTGTGTTTTTGSGDITVAPTGFRVVSVTGGDNVSLAWNAVKGATGYEIAYGPTSGSQEYKQGVGGGATTAATVPGVGAGSAGKHYFEIWALPAATGGPHAGPIEATTTKS